MQATTQTKYELGDRVSVKNENTGEVLEGEIVFVYENGPWFEIDTDDLNSGMYHRDLIVGKLSPEASNDLDEEGLAAEFEAEGEYNPCN